MVFGALLGFLVFLWGAQAQATLKFKKETGKKCIYCHYRVPERDEKDPQLNEEGIKFKENGFRLKEGQN